MAQLQATLMGILRRRKAGAAKKRAALRKTLEQDTAERLSSLQAQAAEELARVGEDRSFATLASFSVKESIYKAIAPKLRRYVGFQEAVVTLPGRAEMRATFARVEVRLQLASGEPAPRVEATITERDGEIVSTARIVSP